MFIEPTKESKAKRLDMNDERLSWVGLAKIWVYSRKLDQIKYITNIYNLDEKKNLLWTKLLLSFIFGVTDRRYIINVINKLLEFKILIIKMIWSNFNLHTIKKLLASRIFDRHTKKKEREMTAQFYIIFRTEKEELERKVLHDTINWKVLIYKSRIRRMS